MFGDELQRQYKGYTICGSAEPVHNDSGLYFAHASVLLIRPDNVCIEVDRYQDHLLTYDEADAENNEEKVEYDKDPETSFWHRFVVGLVGMLPIEDQL